MQSRIITVVGGSGFLGRYVVRELARAGYGVRVVCRNPDAALALKTAGDVGQIALIKGNIAKPESLTHALAGAYAVINLVGILFESGKQNFDTLHAQSAEKLAQMATSAGVARFVHMSSLGVDKAAGSHYARTKAIGEKAVLAAFPTATILRPSVLFGAEDNFFNQFAAMAANPLVPALPLIGGGTTKFQPVYVADVAKACLAAIESADAVGQTYELGGPEVRSFAEILTYIMHTIGKQKPLAKLPFSVASVMGAVSEILPRPPLTRDQVTLLKYDNVVSAGAKKFADLGITPTAIDDVVPQYLLRFHRYMAA